MDGGGGSESDGSPRPSIPSALRPINVARPSNLSEGAGIRIFNDFEQQQQQDAEWHERVTRDNHILTRSPQCPVHHCAHAEPVPRKVLSFAPSRFKPPNGPEPKAFSLLRESEQGGSQSNTPRSPGGTRTPGAYDLFKTRPRRFSEPLEKLEKRSGPLGRQLMRIITRRRPPEQYGILFARLEMDSKFSPRRWSVLLNL